MGKLREMDQRKSSTSLLNLGHWKTNMLIERRKVCDDYNQICEGIGRYLFIKRYMYVYQHNYQEEACGSQYYKIRVEGTKGVNWGKGVNSRDDGVEWVTWWNLKYNFG